MKPILQAFQKRLTNLSGNNRSLLLQRLHAEQFLDVHAFDHVNKTPSWHILEELIAKKSDIQLVPIMDGRDELSNQLSTRLKKLSRREKFLFEEAGAGDLYVGWPFVEGKFNEGTLFRAPLCFFAVRLYQEGKYWYIGLKKDVNISFNKSLLLAFVHYNQIEVPEEWVEYSFDDYDKDATAFRNQLYEQINQTALNIPFSRDFYADKLEGFTQLNRDQMHSAYEQGEMQLKMQAVLGLFPQADSYLVPDYDHLLSHESAEGFEDFFLKRNLSAVAAANDPDSFQTSTSENELFTPFSSDPYQDLAIKSVRKGNSLVVQGPPGTGKSQLICNLAADAIARGKKVLIVSQKRAALDVVYDRLSEKGIDEFTALLHDFKGDRRDIYAKIAHQIEQLNENKRNNNNLDALQLDRTFRTAGLTIDEIVEELEEYKTALFDTSECGLSTKELYLTSNPESERISLVQEYKDFSFDKLQAFERKLDLYLSYAENLNVNTHPWSGRVSFANFRVKDLHEMKACLNEIPKVAGALVKELSAIVNEGVDYDACRTLSENLHRLKEMNSHLKNQEIFELFRPMVHFQNRETELLWLSNTRNLLNKCFEGEGVEQSISSSDIGEVQLILKQRSDAKNTFWKSFKWRFSKEKLRLARILVANGLSDDKASLQILTKRIDNRLNLQHQLTKLKGVGWIHHLPQTQNQKTINLWLDQLELAVRAKLIFNSFANFNEYFSLDQFTAKEFRNTIKAIRLCLKDLPEKRKKWNKYVLPPQIDRLLADEEFLKALKKSLHKDFDTLCELDKLREAMNSSERAVVEKLTDAGFSTKRDAMELFRNSIRLAWIDHMESKYPVLRSVSTIKFDKRVEELLEAYAQKAEASAAILLQRAREKTYQNLAFNRLNNQVTYRDLLHQVKKKKRIWPIRRVINQFYNELFDLLPCWLASPETVSAVFLMEPIFDLVIFDEASQCFVEKGIPAIYRGRQVVIAGDDQQLQPNDLYRVRWEDEREDIQLEADSLLSFAKQYLMQVHLQRHYRSASEALIAFSNEHFYQGKLKMLPDFYNVNSREPSIVYQQVAGSWQNQTNSVEANEVVRWLKHFAQSEEEQTVGIVTFNAAQQSLIQDGIDEAGLENVGRVFVKNIENVQGDERDVILFSTAYAPDEKGKLHLQFGSLNQAGGENRLNVAITRARKKVVIITSIAPSDLKVSHLKNNGPKLFKAYLEHAKQVSEKDFEAASLPTTSFQPTWYLKYQIQKMGKDIPLKLNENTSYADLAIMHRGKYSGLIVTDDDSFYSSPSIKDTFIYQPQHWEAKNWPHKRFHSRTFWLAPQIEKDKLVRFAEDVIHQK